MQFRTDEPDENVQPLDHEWLELLLLARRLGLTIADVRAFLHMEWLDTNV